MTKEILKKIPPLYATDDKDQKEVRVYVKFFFPMGNATWYATEYEPETRTFFGFANIVGDDCAELGYFTLDELEGIKISSLSVERDKSWDDTTTLDQVVNFKVR